MSAASAMPHPRGSVDRPRRDRGMSFIEILVSVVLLGTVGIGVLAALGASIRGSVTHREKVEALAALESAASAIREHADPCTAEQYRTIARSGIAQAEWADQLEVLDVACGTDLHEVHLGITAPSGLAEGLHVTVGGPRVADTPGGGEFDDSTATIVTCAVTDIVATPAQMEVSDLGLLTADVRIGVTTDAICSGTLRAHFTPAPVDPATMLEWQPPFQAVADRQYEVVLTEGTFAWPVGVNDLVITDEQPDGSSAIAGVAPALVEITCRVDATVDHANPTRRPNGRLVDDLTITVAPSPACPPLGSVGFTVETGFETYTDTMTEIGGTWTGLIPGQEEVGPVFAPGPTTLEIRTTGLDPVASVPIEVL